MSTTRTVKIAVIGSGLAGLTAAYRLAKTPCVGDVEFEVHVFEKAAILGMDSHSVSVSLPTNDVKSQGQVERRIDVPMRSFQGGYYPQLISLYTHLGVRFRQADFSYSFAKVFIPHDTEKLKPRRKITTFMIYDGASGRKGISVPASYFPDSHRKTQPTMNSFYAYFTYAISALLLIFFSLRMAYLSLPLRAPQSSSDGKSRGSLCIPLRISFWGLLSKPLVLKIPSQLLPIPVRPKPSVTLREWVDATTPTGSLSRWAGLDKRWQDFATDILIPLFSAVCTAPAEKIWEHPMEEFLDFAYLTIGTHHYVVENGVRDVVQRISAPVPSENIHVASPIVSLVCNSESGSGKMTIDVHCTNNVVFAGFDHVVFATQANHAAALLKTYVDSIIPSSSSADDALPNHGLERHKRIVDAQIDTLSAFSYCQNVVVNHTDSTLMPDAERDRRELNLMMADSRSSQLPTSLETERLCVTPTYAMATHVLLGPANCRPVFQTTNPITPPASDSVLSVSRLERAVVSTKSKEALTGLWREQPASSRAEWKWGCAAIETGVLGPLQGAGKLASVDGPNVPGIWFCGSYAHGGIPLLEGCVVSGRNVVEQGVWASEGLDVASVPVLW